MKIKKNSKMLWLIQSQTTATPKSLCTFFWLFVISVALIPLSYATVIFNILNRNRKFLCEDLHAFYGFILTTLSFVVTTAISKHLKLEFSLLDDLKWSPVILAGILLCVAIFILIVIGIYFLIEKLANMAYDRRQARESLVEMEPVDIVKKEPSMISQYLKAKKEKICPIIEYVD